MPCDQSVQSSKYSPVFNDPTPAEIAAACREIRSHWSEHETRRRSAWAECEPWAAPTVEFDDECLSPER